MDLRTLWICVIGLTTMALVQTAQVTTRSMVKPTFFNITDIAVHLPDRPDPVVTRVCEEEISAFCSHRQDVFPCLSENVGSNKMCPECRQEIEMQKWTLTDDFKLGPVSHPWCAGDVRLFCRLALAEPNREIRNRLVTLCLEAHFADGFLSPNCEHFMLVYMRQGGLDYRNDPVYCSECQTEVRRHCLTDGQLTDDGTVVECMKGKFLSHFLSDAHCSNLVIISLRAGRFDLRTDPGLQISCLTDLRAYCSHVLSREGRQMTCLLEVMSTRGRMQPQCQHMLRLRQSMWKFAAQKSPQSFPEFASHRTRVGVFLHNHFTFFVICGMATLAVIFSVFFVILLSKRRQSRRRQTVSYILVEKDDNDRK